MVRRTCIGWLLRVALLCGGVGAAGADAPQVIAQGAAGPFDVTVLADAPIRPGHARWIVFVGDARERHGASTGTGSQRGAAVEIEIDGMRAEGEAPGSIPVHIHAPGKSTARVLVRHDGREGQLTFEIEVAKVTGASDHWRALSIAPLTLLLFGLHQWRVRGAGARRSTPSRRNARRITRTG